MGILDPAPPPYDPLVWAKKPFAEKSRMVCQAWALQGYGTPVTGFVFYLLKILAYIAGWVLFCSQSPSLGGLSNLTSWWLEPLAFQKAILWSLAFEVLGLGCGSGPLTGRYWPPVGGFLYFLRPGTTKLPTLAGWPLIGGIKRTWLDVLLYLGLLLVLLRLLLAPSLDWESDGSWFCFAAVILPVMGLSDKTVFLAARSEHYWVTLVAFTMTADWIPAAKAIQGALWFWAGFSKLNHHFPSVVSVMVSNSPFLRSAPIRSAMYRSYPDDLRPSRMSVWIAHGGTLLEFSVPLVLLFARGGVATAIGLTLMLALHLFITANIPMGVPLEWNVLMVYGSSFLFGEHASVSPWAIEPVALLVVVVIASAAVPLAGNLFPARVSFLPAMRYYAGNWACSVWLFRGDSHKKLERLTTSSRWVYDQLAPFYDRATAVGLVGKVIAFRLMHLHGRAFGRLVPKAVDRFEDYQWIDGEMVAGLALGWNFGDGHLHNEQLLQALQEQCDFSPGEVRCIFVESQPLGKTMLHWRIVDGAAGPMEEGHVSIDELLQMQAWPTPSTDPSRSH